MKRPKIDKISKQTKEYLKQVLRDYPQTKKSLEHDKSALIPSAVPNYESTPVSTSGESRPTEGLAIRMLSEQSFIIREWEIHAVECTLERLDSTDQKIVDCYFWHDMTTEATAQRINLSEPSVKYHINYIIDLLAYYYGKGTPSEK